jgi:hypothetical protein
MAKPTPTELSQLFWRQRELQSRSIEDLVFCPIEDFEAHLAEITEVEAKIREAQDGQEKPSEG